MGHMEKRGNGYLNGVVCDVTNCHYHDSTNFCTAEQIKVGPQFANTSADTICATFKPQKDMGTNSF